MKTLLLILICAFSAFAQHSQPSPTEREKALEEINSSLATIQSDIDDLNRKKSILERNRVALLETMATDNQQSAFGGAVVVVRVSGERSVVLLIEGQKQEVYLAGLVVKMDQSTNAIDFLTRELSNGIVYPKCKESSCIEVELFTSKDKPSLNCGLIDSGIAMALSTGSLSCASMSSLKVSEPAGEVSQPSSSRTPGTDVHVKGYYRKDGTYVRPHTRSAPGRGRH
jgi:hypothetical protein